jgi:hypothetical protein
MLLAISISSPITPHILFFHQLRAYSNAQQINMSESNLKRMAPPARLQSQALYDVEAQMMGMQDISLGEPSHISAQAVKAVSRPTLLQRFRRKPKTKYIWVTIGILLIGAALIVPELSRRGVFRPSNNS